MPYINELEIMGHAGRDPEYTTTQSGKEMCKFSIAVSQGKDRDTDWFNVVCFGKTAEIANESVRKGGLVMVKGRMQSRAYEGKTYWDVLANRVYTFDKREPKGDAYEAPVESEAAAAFDEESCPF